ncbi:MAG: hypothetical protein M0T74_06240 [Desulfitobacterium hafniense]|nr:hypothetical protein [Desulfitobacterium hafniense]
MSIGGQDLSGVGLNRTVSFFKSPAFGAGWLSIVFFFLIVFASNALLNQVSIKTLGITVNLSTLGFIALVILLLFLI